VIVDEDGSGGIEIADIVGIRHHGVGGHVSVPAED
jgi:hypothetical protein